jgi:ribosomal protein L11 methyltransferase
MENYIQLTIDSDPGGQEILIALLADHGFEGFEECQHQLLAFVPAEKFQSTQINQLLSGMQLNYSKIIVEQKNWNEEWEKNFEPISIGAFCGVRAAFHQTIKRVEHEIIITPKMSFGTGHHATTYLMIEAMRDIEFNHKTVLDFGTGSGILAILAEKLGAKNILAMDNDDCCIGNASENIQSNNCSKIIVEKGDATPHSVQGFDVILANINKNVIMEQLPFFKQQLTSGSVLLISGLLIEDLTGLEKLAESYSLYIASKSLRDNWICVKFLTTQE